MLETQRESNMALQTISSWGSAERVVREAVWTCRTTRFEYERSVADAMQSDSEANVKVS
jgi:hypothetical protein